MKALEYAFLIAYGLFLLSPFWVGALQRARCRLILQEPACIERAWVTAADDWTDCELYAIVDGAEKQLATFNDVRPTVVQLTHLGIVVSNAEVLDQPPATQLGEGASGNPVDWFAVITNTASFLTLWVLFFVYAWYLLIAN